MLNKNQEYYESIIFARSKADKGVERAGFKIIGQPVAIAGASL